MLCGGVDGISIEIQMLSAGEWWHIRARCTFKWDKDYHRYGGAGIKFEWKSFNEFKEDMYDSFLEHVKKHGEANTTIDRIDNNGNYCKDNCRWVTTEQQALNKKKSRFITINGVTKNIATWAKEIGCSRQALRYRLDIGMDPNEILTVPFKHSNKHATLRTSKKNTK